MSRKGCLLSVAVFAGFVGLGVWRAIARVVKLETVVDSATPLSERELIELVGEPDAITDPAVVYRGSGRCIDLTRECYRADWYAPPVAILYPTLWLFAIDREGHVVSRYRYGSP
jgi:hypothetical protein